MTNVKTQDFEKYLNLASDRLGAEILAVSDEFFAAAENLLKSGRGIFIPDKYTEQGKWMDGWESRRKRTAGNDWCIIRLCGAGIIHGIDIDTNHFLGNHPPAASVEGLFIEEGSLLVSDPESDSANWIPLIPRSALKPGSQNIFNTASAGPFTHLRLQIYPDGGVARLKVYGEILPRFDKQVEEIDLAAALNGAKAINCSDMFFSHMDQINLPGRGVNMGDGWETKRSRTADHFDWLILRLANKGWLNRIEIDTAHFKGNFPDCCTLEGCALPDAASEENLGSPAYPWHVILEKTQLQADQIHRFEELKQNGPFNYVRLCIYPDGGISRIRIFGKPEI